MSGFHPVEVKPCGLANQEDRHQLGEGNEGTSVLEALTDEPDVEQKSASLGASASSPFRAGGSSRVSHAGPGP